MYFSICVYKCMNTSYMHLTPLNHFSPHHREEIPPEEDQWEEAAHKGVHRQAAAVCHLEDGERVLWVCTGAVPVRQGTCCQRKGWRTLPAGSKLLLWENLPQKLKMCLSIEELGEDTLYRLGCAAWDKRDGPDYCWLFVAGLCVCSCRTIHLWRNTHTGDFSVIHICASQLDKELMLRIKQVVSPAAPRPSPPFTSMMKVIGTEGLCWHSVGIVLSVRWSDLDSWLGFAVPD